MVLSSCSAFEGIHVHFYLDSLGKDNFYSPMPQHRFSVVVPAIKWCVCTLFQTFAPGKTTTPQHRLGLDIESQLCSLYQPLQFTSHAKGNGVKNQPLWPLKKRWYGQQGNVFFGHFMEAKWFWIHLLCFCVSSAKQNQHQAQHLLPFIFKKVFMMQCFHYFNLFSNGNKLTYLWRSGLPL